MVFHLVDLVLVTGAAKIVSMDQYFLTSKKVHGQFPLWVTKSNNVSVSD